MRENGMPLGVALTLHPRVMAQVGGDSFNTLRDVIVERFLVSPLRDDSSLMAACSFHLAVVCYGKLDESIICRDYGELEDALITNVHGGRELFYGNWWASIEAQEIIRHDILRERITEQHAPFARLVNHLYEMIDKQDRGQGPLPPALAKSYLKEIGELEQKIYDTAKE